jgi:predicted TIM-barrel fold metal-dependent hydrolase
VIVDCHCHAGRGDGLTGPWDTSAPLAKYLRRAARAGIGHSVLFAAFHSDYSVANAEVAAIAGRRPDRFTGFAFVHATRDAGRVRDLVGEAVSRFGFRGIKVHRHDARISREICDAAERFGLPILYDVMGEVMTVELLATEYPRVDFIIPHLGSFSDDWRAQAAFIDLLVRHPNVYTDTSGVRRFDLLQDAVKRAGAKKILFGSDGPWLHPGVELYKVRALGLTPADEALVVGGNLRRILAHDRRTSRAAIHSGGPPRHVEAIVADPWHSSLPG